MSTNGRSLGFRVVVLAVAVCGTASIASAQAGGSAQWQERYLTSLHATGQGLQTFYSAANNGLERFANIPYSELACKNCHEPSLTGGCASCHDTSEPGVGAQVDDGVAEGQACAGCHGRQAREIATGLGDVHYDAGMTCMDCHPLEDVMGDGNSYSSLTEEGAIAAACETCHTNPASNPYHDVHGSTVACATCHMQGMITCYNCHYLSELPEGESQLLRQVTDWIFLVNRGGKVHPANIHTLTYQGNNLLIIAPGYAHTIARNAVSGCGDCHGNAHVLDLDEDSMMIVAGFDGTADVTTAQGFIPVPFNFEKALLLDFLVYDAGSETWSLLARGQDATQFMFAEPLSDEQLRKLRQ